METQEEEYQCSDCGATVSADAKNCPSCGVSLEETSEEDQLVKIPIPSNPSDLSSIKSILEGNKIEYSIDNNSMDSVFGLPIGQPVTLWIHKDQIKLVNEIINSFIAKEKVQILDTDVFTKEGDESEEQKAPLIGVEGWLLFFAMFLIFNPIAYIPYNINTYIEIKDDQIWFPFKDGLLIIDLVLVIIISCLSIYAGLKLWRIRPDAIKATFLFLNVFLVYSLFIFLLVTIILSISKIPFNTAVLLVYGGIIRETISSITFVLIWKFYLKNSERVKNTFSIDVEL